MNITLMKKNKWKLLKMVAKQKSLIDSSGNVNTPDFAQASQQYKETCKV
jgi:hypothetical protein